MGRAVSFPSHHQPEDRGLAFWMKRTLERLADFRSDPSINTVHDLRVALRRCRSIAAVMEEIDPHPDWEEMRDCARKLFRSLGALRDAQALAEWLNYLHPEEETTAEAQMKRQVLEELASREKAANERLQHRAARFDQNRWRKLSRTLVTRMRRVPAESDAARCLAFERLEEVKELHRRAMRAESAKPWHGLRIGVKHFRYTVESLLPVAHAEWIDSLKRVQDVLGNIHDLDVLGGILKKTAASQPGDTIQDWETKIAGERHKNIETYRQLSLGTTGVWNTFLAGFPRDSWQRYADARIRATRGAMDTKPARSLVTRRIAVRLWSQLRISKAGQAFSDKKEQRALQAAANLIGVRDPRFRKPREKFARTFLLESPVPPRWSFAEWERVAWAVRFQRGAEPGPQNKRFAKLAPEQQAKICLLAGILRLAIALQRCGVQSSSCVRLEVLPQGFLLHAAGVQDSPKNAARLTEAKGLLERNLGKTILIQAEAEAAVHATTAKPSSGPLPISVVR
jgi:CHAD domain-containing protein